ncbi:MAG: FKBP-type peptidyl-prolyl cis-trans isomerase [Prevotella sp.]|nr:FKBP-type peptidyl-prolyl cis-trans isomerase [Prevotella sp.]
MRRLIIVALTLVVSASFFTASAAGKDKKKKKAKTEQAAELQPVQLVTTSDTLSYINGMAMSTQLDRYLKQQYGLTFDECKDVFLKGFDDAVGDTSNTAMKAYAAGIMIAVMTRENTFDRLKGQYGPGLRSDYLLRGLRDALTSDSTHFNMAQAREIQTAAATRRTQEIRKASEDFIARNGSNPNVVTTESGLQYKVIKQGTGAIPQSSDMVEVRYEGRLVDGTVFDSTANHGKESDTFRVDRLIKGWTEALTMMPVGSKWEIYIPYQLGYGVRPSGKIPGYSALIFTLELLDIKK